LGTVTHDSDFFLSTHKSHLNPATPVSICHHYNLGRGVSLDARATNLLDNYIRPSAYPARRDVP